MPREEQVREGRREGRREKGRKEGGREGGKEGDMGEGKEGDGHRREEENTI